MASAKATLDLSASPDEVWKLIGGFGSLPDWVSGVHQSKLDDGGRVRHLHDDAGHFFVEQLETYDHAGRRYSYSILQSPISVKNYLSTLAVIPAALGTGSHIEWSATFDPVDMSKEASEEIFHEIFSQGLASLNAKHMSAAKA